LNWHTVEYNVRNTNEKGKSFQKNCLQNWNDSTKDFQKKNTWLMIWNRGSHLSVFWRAWTCSVRTGFKDMEHISVDENKKKKKVIWLRTVLKNIYKIIHWRRVTFNESLTKLRHLEKPKIQVFCQGKKFQFSNKISHKFSFCENSVSLFLPWFALVYIFIGISKKLHQSQTYKKKIIGMIHGMVPKIWFFLNKCFNFFS
jgi:hypothetical protein